MGPMLGSSASYMFGPFVAVLAVAALALILRWAFRRGGSLVPRRGRSDEYGLLVSVAAPPTYVEGELLRRRLESAGIRANLAQTLDGPHIMVWPEDQERAREYLSRKG